MDSAVVDKLPRVGQRGKNPRFLGERLFFDTSPEYLTSGAGERHFAFIRMLLYLLA